MADDPTQPPTMPDPLSPAQQRQRRVRRMAIVRESQEQGLLPNPAPAPLPAVAAHTAITPVRGGGRPASKRFTLEEITAQRVPVHVGPEAQEIIDASTSEGRVFPQALSEAFGQMGNVRGVWVIAIRKSTYFSVGPDELHPLTGEPGGAMLLEITVEHAGHPAIPAHTYWMNAQDLIDLHPLTRIPMFRAHLAAAEHWRLYPHQQTPVPPVVDADPALESAPATPPPARKRRSRKRA